MEKSKIPYKLVQHLREICQEQKKYEALLSVWQINRESCHKILENIIIHYPHYTLHDLSHSESIITNIEMLLGEQTIRKLSPTDTWLLLQAAYLHDFGMVLIQDDIDKNWGTEEFQDYLQSLKSSYDPALQEAAKYILDFRNMMSDSPEEILWPLRIRKYVTLIIADYYRGKHASMSREYLGKLAKDWGLDLGFNGLIPQRLIFLLGDVSYLHTEDTQAVLKLDSVANGFDGDYIHPRFVAEMLRMGDLLDIDNNRFNPYTEKATGMRPASSDIHIQKHLSTTHIVITPSFIEYRADCETEAVYRETQHFVTWLKLEVNFLTLNWRDIMPEDMEGSAPRLREPELLLRGEKDIANVTDLRFEISQEKAFETLEGANIYDNQYIFLREVIQNALDACKLQLWEDLCAGKYSSWMEDVDLEDLKPFQINSKIYENYKVKVILQDIGDYIEIIIKDNGIGISTETFHRICKVGTSYAGDKQWKKTLKEMPRWLRPTAGFGIGLQSIFLVAEEFEIYSRSNGKGIKAIVESRKKAGYVQLHQNNDLESDGTEIHVRIQKDKPLRYTWGSNTSNYLHTKYDPFEGDDLTMQFWLLDEINKNCSKTFFPIEIYFDKELQQQIKPYTWPEFDKKQRRYAYKWLDKTNSKMQLWDMEQDVMFEFILLNRDKRRTTNIYFKGMKVDEPPFFSINSLSIQMDFYGLDSKTYLSLDRKTLKNEHHRDLNKIVVSAFDFFCNQIWNYISQMTGTVKFKTIFPNVEKPKQILYHFWKLISMSQKEELVQKYRYLFDKINISVTILQKSESGNYEITQIPMLKILDHLEEVATFNINHWMPFGQNKKSDARFLILRKIVNKNQKRIPYKTIIIDRAFMEAFSDSSFSELRLLDMKEGIIALTNITKKTYPQKISADDETTKIIFRQMVVTTLSLTKDWLGKTMRMYAPALEKYRALAVKKLKPGMWGNTFGVETIMISPITAYDLEKIEKMSYKEFVEYIVQQNSYKKLLEYTHENQYDTDKYTMDTIDKTYRKLIRDYYESNVWRLS